MKKEYAKRLPVNEMDLPAVEGWLQQMAREGLFLEETAGLLWYFRAGEPGEVRYRLETLGRPEQRPEEERREAYEEAGWRYVTTHRGQYHIYMAEDGEAEELHTDPLVRSLEIEKGERRQRASWLESLLVLCLQLFLWKDFLEEGKEGLLLWLLDSRMPLLIVLLLFFILLTVKAILGYGRLRAIRKRLEAGDSVMAREPEKTKKAKKAGRGGLCLWALLVILLGAAFLGSCATGCPVEQQLAYGETLPALQLLEEGRVIPAGNETQGSRRTTGEETGTVYYYSHPLLREHFEVEQEALIVPRDFEAEKQEEEPLTEEEKESLLSQGAYLAGLKAVYYEPRLSLLASGISRELREGCEREGALFRPLAVTGFEEALASELAGEQLLLLRGDNKILLLRYRGEESLEERAELFKAVMDGSGEGNKMNKNP